MNDRKDFCINGKPSAETEILAYLSEHQEIADFVSFQENGLSISIQECDGWQIYVDNPNGSCCVSERHYSPAEIVEWYRQSAKQPDWIKQEQWNEQLISGSSQRRRLFPLLAAGILLVAWSSYVMAKLPLPVCIVLTFFAVVLFFRRGNGDRNRQICKKAENIPSRILETAHKTPPHCLDGFHLHEISESSNKISIDEDSICWQLECPCGGKHFEIHGYELNRKEKDYISDPITATCSVCGRTIPVFDDRKDGYNGMLNAEEGISATPPESEKKQTLSGLFQLMIVCQYAFDDDEAEAEDFTADYFTNIIGYGIKDGESIKAIFDRETA